MKKELVLTDTVLGIFLKKIMIMYIIMFINRPC